MINETNEREILISDLLKAIVKQWRLLLIGTVLVAVCFSGYMMQKGYRTALENQQKQDDTQVDTTEEFTEIEWAQITKGIKQKQLVIAEQEYLEKSELMKINANEEAVVNLYYQVVCQGDGNELQAIKTRYMSFLESDDTIQSIVDGLKWEVDIPYISERISIIEVSEVWDNNESDSMDINIDDESQFIFGIKVVGADQTDCTLLAEELAKLLEDYASDIEVESGARLMLISSNAFTCVDNQLLEMQNARITNFQAHLSNWEVTAITLTQQQTVMVEQGASGGVVADLSQEETTESIKMYQYLTMGNVVIGIVAGVVGICFLIVLYYLFSNKIKDEKDFRRRFGLPVFGVIDDMEAEHLERALINVQAFCDEKKINKIVFCDMKENSKYNATMEDVVGKLKDTGIIAECIKNPLYDITAFRKVNEIQNIMLVGDIGQVKIQEVEAFMEYPNDNWKIVGAILFQ